MKKSFLSSLILCFVLSTSTVHAQSSTYTVVSGDTMWKIAVKNQVGISELISANPQIANPAMIIPGQKISIPNIDVKTMENQVIKLVNQSRVNAGLQPFTANWELSRVARYKSQDMANKGYFDHTSPTYGSPFTMMQNFGIKFTAAGENIAMGQRTAQEVMNSWMNSPGHRANILNPSFNQIGVGLAKNSNGTCYWTQQFIKSY
ncbi:SafA/ExsA family spore coat assembly protein [Clostridium coskatii]|uniref:Chlorophenol reductase n=1 Tax=Clostridium coskatii TaxID=1705578 RepID=A0A166TVP8_9CLOT|nr:SafA/ExsA family spore coat assembly protein [Clostridium coskatii]OAA94157.1 Chlorophenol reductase precursor [Clostridium coskatii]OBR95574.1 chlorophenol reductase precursor [Clostridium coskatii]